MKKVCHLIGVLVVAGAFLGVAAIGTAQPHQAGPPSPQRAAVEEWVRFINGGNQRAACGLQVVAEANGQPCAALPERQVLRCPKDAAVRNPKASEVRKAYEQVGAITDEGPGRASAVLRSQRKKSRLRGALGLEQVEGAWRVSYLRQGGSTFVPAGSVWMTETWRKLWYPPTCSR